MKKKYAVLTYVAVIVGVLMMTVGSAKAVMIDSFDVGFHGVAGNSTSTFPIVDTKTGLSTSEVIGGARTLEILDISGGSTSFTSASLEVLSLGANSVLAFSNAAGATSSALVTWDADGAGLGGLDLEAGGAFSIGIEVLSIDVGLVDLTVNIIDTGDDLATRALLGVGLGQNIFEFANFINEAAVDFSAVKFISLEIATLGSATDLTIDFFDTLDEVEPPPPVPEPTTVALLGIGLAGLGGGYLRRRFRKARKV